MPKYLFIQRMYAATTQQKHRSRLPRRRLQVNGRRIQRLEGEVKENRGTWAGNSRQGARCVGVGATRALVESKVGGGGYMLFRPRDRKGRRGAKAISRSDLRPSANKEHCWPITFTN